MLGSPFNKDMISTTFRRSFYDFSIKKKRKNFEVPLATNAMRPELDARFVA
jgi:hypothetical protein